MVQDWKTVRIFLSGIFRDMNVERDHFVRFVFPGGGFRIGLEK